MQGEDKILNCPFCGKEPDTRITFSVPIISCINKKCPINPCTWLGSNENSCAKVAIKRWNTREKETYQHNNDYYNNSRRMT